MASGRRRHGGQDVNLSKKLIRILRHDARSLGLCVHEGGFVDVDSLLELSDMTGYDRQDIEAVANSDNKSRYTLDRRNGRLRIKATQGHSIKISDQSLEEITSFHQAPVVIHGTTLSSWRSIRRDGLSRMNRIHIHFAAGLPGDPNVTSGMPHRYQVAIYIDMRKVLQARPRIKSFRAENGVILTGGDRNGILEPQYFEKVIERHTGRDLLQDDTDEALGRMTNLYL